MNADYTVLSQITWQDAVMKVVEGKAFVVRADPNRILRSPSTTMTFPLWVALTNWVHKPYREPKVEDIAIRRAVLNRDGWCCAYCGSEADTVDHILPESRGGEFTYHNLVAACFACNNKKADRTPEEAGMVLLWNPFDPRSMDKEQREVNKWLKSQM